ncbi:MAG: PD40 domain-containing protein [Melioribacteraceae bacterium]|nr:PD40 domain-containing protein [Melioribacteraceae bacterium]
MKKNNTRFIILSVLLICFLSAELFAQKIYFCREGHVYVSDSLTNKETKLFEGTNPQISPNGKNIVYTQNEFSSTALKRYIGIYNNSTKKNLILKDIPGNENFSPKWSPDSKHILFSHKKDSLTKAAVVYTSGKGFKVISNGMKTNIGIGGWKSDGKRVLLYDKENLFEVDINGEILKKTSLTKIIGEYGFSWDMNFQFFQKDKVLIFTALNDDDFIEGYVYAPSVLFIFDPMIGVPFRITPKGLNVTSFNFMDNKSTIIFSALTSETIRKGKDNIYKIDTRGHNLKQILENGVSPSFRKN